MCRLRWLVVAGRDGKSKKDEPDWINGLIGLDGYYWPVPVKVTTLDAGIVTAYTPPEFALIGVPVCQ